MTENKTGKTGEKGDVKHPDSIIKKHMHFSMIGGGIPIPLVDIAAVTAIQLDMIRQLANEYKVDYNEERGKSLVAAIIASSVGSIIGRTGASLVKAIPGIGTLLGIGSQVIFAGATTYAIGNIFKTHFSDNGNLYDMDIKKAGSKFKDLFRKGKTLSNKMNANQSKEEIFETIEKLNKLKESKVITEEEFQTAKKNLLDRL